MARKKSEPIPEPEDESQELEDEELEDADEEEDEDEEETEADQPKMSKVNAIRAALAAGAESPDDGVNYILDHFGLEIKKSHFSAVKSGLRKKEREAGGSPAASIPSATRAPKASVPAVKQGAVDGGMVGDLAAVKDLVRKLGAAQVRQIVDLFED